MWGGAISANKMRTFFRTHFLSVTIGALFLVVPQFSLAATLDVSPISVSVSQGQMVKVAVTVSTSDAINAVSGTLNFPTSLLQVSSVSKASSVLTLWVQDPSYSNGSGTISFSGVAPNPGFTGTRGNVVTVTFVGKKQGTATLTFSGGAQVLANDGNGTNVLSSANPGSVTIGPSLPNVIVGQTAVPAPTETTTTAAQTLVCPPTPSAQLPSDLVLGLLIILIVLLLVVIGLVYWFVWRPYHGIRIQLEHNAHVAPIALQKQLVVLKEMLRNHHEAAEALREEIKNTQEALEKEIEDSKR